MSLLMQALRKAERAKRGSGMTEPHPHEDGELQLEPLETDVQKAVAAGSGEGSVGGASFTLEPLEPAEPPRPAPPSATGSLADEDIPVIPATEAVHDPVPPQARPGARRNAVAEARAAAEARRAADMPHGPGAPGGLSAEPPPHAAPHSIAGEFNAQGASATPAGTAAIPPDDAAAVAAAGPAGVTGAAAAPFVAANPDEAYFATRPAPPAAAAAGVRAGAGGASAGAASGARQTRATPPGVRPPGSASDHLGRPQPGNGHASADGSAPYSRTAAASRASAAASRQRLLTLGGLLGLVVLGFAYLYWKGISSPGAGAALPPVPMPGNGTLATAPAAAQGSAIPGADAAQPTAALPPSSTIPAPPAGDTTGITAPAASSTGTGAAGATAAVGAQGANAAGMTAGGAAGTVAGSPASGMAPAAASGAAAPAGNVPFSQPAAGAERPAVIAGAASPGHGAAPAPRPPARVVIPTPEALASIEDPAIRAEAMRDAAERSARAARDADIPKPGGVQYGPEAPVLASTASAAGAISHTPPRAAASAAPTRKEAPAGHPALSISGGTPSPPGASDVHIVRNNVSPQVSPTLQNAWSAYQAGDLAAARQQYDMALLQEPNNRDALLGSAAVAIKERNGQQAASNYVRLLELNPNDPEALSALVALRPGDLAQAETKLKGILRTTPESGPVLFTLGNLYAKQGRWSEAQQAYFRAFSATPTNPDYAFNLAIGLDRLNQGRLAQDYYQKALNLAQSAPAGFDPNAVRRRLAELGAATP